jgi:hypothetical protein
MPDFIACTPEYPAASNPDKVREEAKDGVDSAAEKGDFREFEQALDSHEVRSKRKDRKAERSEKSRRKIHQLPPNDSSVLESGKIVLRS